MSGRTNARSAAAPRPTVRLLLEKLVASNKLFCDYMNLRLTRVGRASAAETMLSKLSDRGLVLWEGDVIDTEITDAGRAYLKKLQKIRRKRSFVEKANAEEARRVRR